MGLRLGLRLRLRIRDRSRLGLDPRLRLRFRVWTWLGLAPWLRLSLNRWKRLWFNSWLRLDPCFRLRFQVRTWRRIRSRLGLDGQIRLEHLMGTRWNILVAELIDGLARQRRYGKFHSGRFRSLRERVCGRPRDLGLQSFSILTEFLDVLSVLCELLALVLGHRLQSQRTILTLGQLSEGCGGNKTAVL